MERLQVRFAIGKESVRAPRLNHVPAYLETVRALARTIPHLRTEMWGTWPLDFLGNDALIAELLKKRKEAVLCGDIIQKAESSAFAHIGDDFDRAAEVGVGVPG